MPEKNDSQRVVAMEFRTFLQGLIHQIPKQIVTTGRKIVYRFLGWNRWLSTILDTWAHVRGLRV